MQLNSSLHAWLICCLLLHLRTASTRHQGVGWHHTGSRVAYYANSIRRGRRGTYHTLTFTLTLTGSPADWVHLAHYYPYTFTDLQRSLAVLMAVRQHACWGERRGGGQRWRLCGCAWLAACPAMWANFCGWLAFVALADVATSHTHADPTGCHCLHRKTPCLFTIDGHTPCPTSALCPVRRPHPRARVWQASPPAPAWPPPWPATRWTCSPSLPLRGRRRGAGAGRCRWGSARWWCCQVRRRAAHGMARSRDLSHCVEGSMCCSGTGLGACQRHQLMCTTIGSLQVQWQSAQHTSQAAGWCDPVSTLRLPCVLPCCQRVSTLASPMPAG
jgi:hypothetical protein